MSNRVLYVSREELEKFTYLRKTFVLGGPRKFSHRRKFFHDQKLIAAIEWLPTRGAISGIKVWNANVYWLKTYDVPFSHKFYPGGPGNPGSARGPHPCEAVPVEEVLKLFCGEDNDDTGTKP